MLNIISPLRTVKNSFNLISHRTIIMGYRKPFSPKPKVKENRQDRATRSKRIIQLIRESLENDEPNFIPGKKPIYLPFATIKLLRPNAKHTPYQAKFIVPKSFNKLDLRDYLYHIYGLRTLNITSALMPGKFIRSMPAPYGSRYRDKQIKKMTVDLIDPFVWPAENEMFKQEKELTRELNNYREEKANAINSDREKPSKAFGGIIDKNPRPMNFVSKIVRRQMKNLKSKDIELQKKLETDKFITSYINL
ncbi:mitochondrial 54S ribosomal protein YmL41 [Pichia kluyveri]|uniref:Large ribosomal subunit protein uL23m n=1 Tax=Pichia kluyveri TaxID=36015 RepID=A0AAV5RC07_PICKL|nr:mitochondrial 54S ribosomal protein YmL41 [Pichia kluyveri]